jgi:hypothetical protein
VNESKRNEGWEVKRGREEDDKINIRRDKEVG